MLKRLKDIEILDKHKILGEGAFSKVLKVKSKLDNKIYALKKIDINKVSKSDCENLKVEIKLHQKLFHKNIIKFYDCLQVKNMVYFLLEYATNGCLFFYIHSQKGIPEQITLRFLYQTALAIKHLHDRNLIHRDIKPENILIDENFNVKLCDFGWSCFLNNDDYRTSVCGTYEYMSPEIVNDRLHTNKVDMWCLGILLYELLHGNPPYKASDLDEIHKEISQNRIMINSCISKDTKDLMKNLLRKNPENRYDIDEMLRHPAFEKNKKEFLKPLKKQDLETLIRNFILNSDGSSNNIPDIIKNYKKNGIIENKSFNNEEENKYCFKKNNIKNDFFIEVTNELDNPKLTKNTTFFDEVNSSKYNYNESILNGDNETNINFFQTPKKDNLNFTKKKKDKNLKKNFFQSEKNYIKTTPKNDKFKAEFNNYLKTKFSVKEKKNENNFSKVNFNNIKPLESDYFSNKIYSNSPLIKKLNNKIFMKKKNIKEINVKNNLKNQRNKIKSKDKKINSKKKKKKKLLIPKKILTPKKIIKSKNYNKIKFENKFSKNDEINLYEKLQKNKILNSSINLTKNNSSNPSTKNSSTNYFNFSSNYTSEKNSILIDNSIKTPKNIFSSKYLNSNSNNNKLLNKLSSNTRSRSLINTTKLKSNTFIDSNIFFKRNKNLSQKNGSIILKENNNKKEEEKKNSYTYLKKNSSNYLKKNHIDENKLEKNDMSKYLRLNDYKYDKTELNVQLSKTKNILYNNRKKEENIQEKSSEKKRNDIMNGNKVIYSGSRRNTDITRLKETSLSRKTSMSKFKYVVINGKLIKKDLTEEEKTCHRKNLAKSHSSLLNRTSSVIITSQISRKDFSKEKNIKNTDKHKFAFTNNYIKFDNEKKKKFNFHINKESEEFMEFSKKNIRVVSSRDLKSYILRDKKKEVNKDVGKKSPKNNYVGRSQSRFDSINLEDTDIIYKSKK